MLHLPQNKLLLKKGDPYFASVVFLSGWEGTNGGTTFTDEETTPKTLTGNGGVTTSTAQFKFGASSLFCDLSGGADYITTPASTDFDFSGQYTIETFARFASGGGISSSLFNRYSATSTDARWALFISGGILRWRHFDTAGTQNDISYSFNPTANQWYHIAVDKDASNVVRLYVDGVMQASNTFSLGTRTTGTAPNLSIGSIQGFLNSFDLGGYLDESRITSVAV